MDKKLSYAFPPQLMRAAEMFNKHGTTLYAVGGVVRDALLGLRVNDIDVASAMRPDDVCRLCDSNGLTVILKGLRYGTVEMVLPCGDGANLHIEHTTFRRDIYGGDGAHRPEYVKFSDELSDDALRRDFTINALYADILTGEIIDPTGGLDDIKLRTIRTANAPAVTLRDDGLRIMRFARFCAQLGFTPEGSTYECAKEYSHLLGDISKERIFDEALKVLLCDVRYCGEDAIERDKTGFSVKVQRGLTLLKEINALKYVFPGLEDCAGIAQNPKYHAFDVLDHSIRTAAFTPPVPQMRLAGLLHDIAKPICVKRNGSMHTHELIGADISREMLTQLRCPNDLRDSVCQLIALHMYDINNTAKDSTLRRRFASWGESTVRQLIELRRADVHGSGRNYGDVDSADRWERMLCTMKSEGAPLSYDELKCTGTDIAEWLSMPPSPEIGRIKRMLLEHCAMFPADNTKERLKKTAYDCAMQKAAVQSDGPV